MRTGQNKPGEILQPLFDPLRLRRGGSTPVAIQAPDGRLVEFPFHVRVEQDGAVVLWNPKTNRREPVRSHSGANVTVAEDFSPLYLTVGNLGGTSNPKPFMRIWASDGSLFLDQGGDVPLSAEARMEEETFHSERAERAARARAAAHTEPALEGAEGTGPALSEMATPELEDGLLPGTFFLTDEAIWNGALARGFVRADRSGDRISLPELVRIVKDLGFRPLTLAEAVAFLSPACRTGVNVCCPVQLSNGQWANLRDVQKGSYTPQTLDSLLQSSSGKGVPSVGIVKAAYGSVGPFMEQTPVVS